MPTTEIFKLDRRHKAHREGFRVALRIRRDVHEIMDQGSISSWEVYKRVEKLKDRLGQMYPDEGRWNPHHWASWRSKPRRDQKNLSSYMREGDYIIAVRNEHDITVLLMADPG
jgi:hypothetical protein